MCGEPTKQLPAKMKMRDWESIGLYRSTPRVLIEEDEDDRKR